MNLDPLGEQDDATLNAALRAAGLFALQGGVGASGESAKITLDTMLASGGGNLSQGQRQILALSRALIRGSKILILDEGLSLILCLLVIVLNFFQATSAIGGFFLFTKAGIHGIRLRDGQSYTGVVADRAGQGRHRSYSGPPVAEHYGRRQNRACLGIAVSQTNRLERWSLTPA